MALYPWKKYFINLFSLGWWKGPRPEGHKNYFLFNSTLGVKSAHNFLSVSITDIYSNFYLASANFTSGPEGNSSLNNPSIFVHVSEAVLLENFHGKYVVINSAKNLPEQKINLKYFKYFHAGISNIFHENISIFQNIFLLSNIFYRQSRIKDL